MDLRPFFFHDAAQQFWHTRASQAQQQVLRGASDQGTRGAVTGGQHLNGFVGAIAALLVDQGVEAEDIFYKRAGSGGLGSKTELPGYFRTSKNWDMLVLNRATKSLRAVIELKAQVGSFGNNFNNRVEEALGNSTEFWTAYREEAFQPSPRPWLGYLFVLADEEGSRRPGSRVVTPHFPIRPEFQSASYARRVELFCRRLVLERQYSSACLILADPDRADEDENYEEPAQDVGVDQFLTDLVRNTTNP